LGLARGRSEEWMRKYPRWPGTATVCKHFGLWSRAVDAADLPPARAIAPGRGMAERVQAARRLSAEGFGSAEIAALLEISPRTVRSYLRAGSCRDCRRPVIAAARCRRCSARRAIRPHWDSEDV